MGERSLHTGKQAWMRLYSELLWAVRKQQDALGTEGRTDTEKLPISNFLWVILFFYLLRVPSGASGAFYCPNSQKWVSSANTVAHVQLVKQPIISIIVRYDYTIMYQKLKVAIPRKAECYTLQTEQLVYNPVFSLIVSAVKKEILQVFCQLNCWITWVNLKGFCYF